MTDVALRDQTHIGTIIERETATEPDNVVGITTATDYGGPDRYIAAQPSSNMAADESSAPVHRHGYDIDAMGRFRYEGPFRGFGPNMR